MEKISLTGISLVECVKCRESSIATRFLGMVGDDFLISVLKVSVEGILWVVLAFRKKQFKVLEIEIRPISLLNRDLTYKLSEII